MEKRRRTSEEVTNDMFYKREEKGDLVVIAADRDGYWCKCSGRCQCGKPRKNFFAKQTYIYRSIGKPNLCFFQVWNCDEDANSSYTLYRFKYKYLEHVLEPDMALDETEYNAQIRKRKLRKVLAIR
ncbi:hypothetical protein [Pontibacter chinhatensis]|uniref:Uncharacterized protein n=1 Tax=Pontibacter chinhatensis TaxID=1436961 RepID=A0A1I2ZSL8_9BACT|nr:hypothetical protein [Pontibacter chinhatensis]SFH40808.1 hypothetical protein SAMN05421739_11824 [Pontibacter chinhatensis]